MLSHLDLLIKNLFLVFLYLRKLANERFADKCNVDQIVHF